VPESGVCLPQQPFRAELPSHSEVKELNREQGLRLRARELGYVLRKSWTDGSVYRDGV
jgi:hypothetical protein